MAYITGLKIKRLLATTDKFGKALDLNANIILEYENGAHGAYWCSQVAAGHCNGLAVRVYGDKGSIEWVQENPEVIRYTARGESPQFINRGTGAVKEKAGSFGRIPAGHPEGLYVAFANLYKEYLNAIEAKKAGKDTACFDYPSVSMGLDGVKFVHAVIKSAADNSKWVEL